MQNPQIAALETDEEQITDNINGASVQSFSQELGDDLKSNEIQRTLSIKN